MTFVRNTPLRTLAIDPTSRGLAFAVLEGSERLIDWGLMDIEYTKDDRHFAARVKQLMSRYEPSAVAVEALDGTRRRGRGRDRVSRLVRFACRRGVTILRASRSEVQTAFTESGSTKWEIAVAISRLFPELEPWLPAQRKPWTSEALRANIFDAVSLALVGLRRAERERVE